jgi:hypothetical protein
MSNPKKGTCGCDWQAEADDLLGKHVPSLHCETAIDTIA